ncbi:MAG: hypothetical protein QOD82_49, partial [Pseudonocardiales bacterium]|nr:hypothetical protein [Pseudonocardiales bacterium]
MPFVSVIRNREAEARRDRHWPR